MQIYLISPNFINFTSFSQYLTATSSNFHM